MSAKDRFHELVKTALQEQGWRITDDPLEVDWGGAEVYIDLAAEKVIGVERDGQKIAVEIKSFISQSDIYDFHLALGQFLNYRLILSQKEPERSLYLAIPLETYNTFFRLAFTQAVIAQYQLKLLIYSIKRREIDRWLN